MSDHYMPAVGRYQMPSSFPDWLEEWQVDPDPEYFLNAFAADTEGTGLYGKKPLPSFNQPVKPFLLTGCWDDGSTAVSRCRFIDPETRVVVWDTDVLYEWLDWLTNSRSVLVMHNAPFDIKGFAEIGINLYPMLYEGRIMDTLAASHVLDSRESHGLKELCVKYDIMLDTDQKWLRDLTERARRFAKKFNIRTAPNLHADYWLPEYIVRFLSDNPHLIGKKEQEFIHDAEGADEDYGVKDAIRTQLLWKCLFHALCEEGLWPQYCREIACMKATCDMETAGLHMRKQATQRERNRYVTITGSHAETLRLVGSKYGLPDFNPNSTKQLTELMYDKLELPVLVRTKSGNPSTNADTLEQLQLYNEDHRDRTQWSKDCRVFVNNLVEYRRFNSAVTYTQTYIDHAVVREGQWWLYPTFNQWGTSWTRLSSSNPNAQNIGKRDEDRQLRACFGPPDDWEWYACDYDQLEIRTMAGLSDDPTLKKMLLRNGDMHQITADALGVPRSGGPRSGKHINFAWQYGAGSAKLSAMAGMDVATFNTLMRQTYPGVMSFMDETIGEVKRSNPGSTMGWVFTMFGYRLAVPKWKAYIGINGKSQGTAGDVCKNAMIGVWEYIHYNGLRDVIRLILNVHDELVFEVRKGIPRSHIRNLRDIMEAAGNPVGLTTPCEMSRITTGWNNTKPLRRL